MKVLHSTQTAYSSPSEGHSERKRYKIVPEVRSHVKLVLIKEKTHRTLLWFMFSPKTKTDRDNSFQNSIRLVDWSARCLIRGFPFQPTSTERRVEVACPKAAHTPRSRVLVPVPTVLFFHPLSGFSCGPSFSSSNSSGWAVLQASEVQLPLLKNLPTMTTL